MSGGYSPVRKLLTTDQADAFDCGENALNQFLQRYALVNQKANSAQTYVCCQGDVVVGFYCLAVGSVDPQAAPSRVMKGLGQALLKDALLRTAQAADIAGIRCLLVHAKDDTARQWYESWEFEPSPTDPYHLFLLLIPQCRRSNRQIEQRDVARQRVVRDGRHDVGRQRGQVGHAAHMTVVDSLTRGDPGSSRTRRTVRGRIAGADTVEQLEALLPWNVNTATA